jgi:hypothetical protein
MTAAYGMDPHRPERPVTRGGGESPSATILVGLTGCARCGLQRRSGEETGVAVARVLVPPRVTRAERD